MNTTTKPTTPGYNCRLSIALSADKRGRMVAYYLSRTLGSMRWIRMSLPIALDAIAQETADQIPYARA